MADTQELREAAKGMFAAAVRRAEPAKAVRRQLENCPLRLVDGGRCFVLAVGKAATAMMREALAILPDVKEALVVTNPENHCQVEGATVMLGAHPVPDASSAKAGRAAIELLQKAGAGDHVVALISGGGSALMIAPAPGISVTDYGVVNKIMLAGGLEINEINLVRQHIDNIKGGGLLQHATPAQVHGLLLSDVIGDDLRAIASGPTVSPIGTRQQAVSLLKSADIWSQVPASIRDHLTKATAPLDLPQAHNHLIGSNRHSLDAMLGSAPKGYDARIVSDSLTGDVKDAAVEIVQAAKSATGPVALIFGGETTVRLAGNGQGGRNQELALRVAHCAQGSLPDGWVFLSGGTDGRDGPTDAAGGLVDAGTLARIASAEGDLTAMLTNNDSYAALSLAGDLLLTGGTGTNVADVQVLLCPAPDTASRPRSNAGPRAASETKP